MDERGNQSSGSPQILVVEVVGMLPHIHRQQWDELVIRACQRSIGIGSLHDLQAAIASRPNQPSPATSEHRNTEGCE